MYDFNNKRLLKYRIRAQKTIFLSFKIFHQQKSVPKVIKKTLKNTFS